MRGFVLSLMVVLGCSQKPKCELDLFDPRPELLGVCVQQCEVEDNAASCETLGDYFGTGIGSRVYDPAPTRDLPRARKYWQKACDLGRKSVCHETKFTEPPPPL